MMCDQSIYQVQESTFCTLGTDVIGDWSHYVDNPGPEQTFTKTCYTCGYNVVMT